MVQAQPGGHLFRHMQEEGFDHLPPAGVGGHDLAMADGFRRIDLTVHRVGIESLGHQPDTPPRVAETASDLADGQAAHVATGIDAPFRQVAADALGDTAQLGDRHLGEGLLRGTGGDNGQAVGFC